MPPKHSDRADPRQIPREGPVTLSKALQGTGVVPAHFVVSWLLRCSHAVTCHCGHDVGKMAYCWYCGEWVTVVAKEVRQYDTKGRAIEGAGSYVSRHRRSNTDTRID